MRKIKEMSDASVPKGYTEEDAKSVCDEHYRQKQDRLDRIEGYSENTHGGFIPRNNVRERL